MKVLMFVVTCFVASAALTVAVANAQYAGGAGAGAATQDDSQAGQSATQQPAGVGAQQQGQLDQQGALPQSRTVTPQAPLGIETQQDPAFPPPGRVDTQADDTLLRQSQARERGAAAGDQRAELGVWLTASGGPGVEIRSITSGSAAEAAGLQPGDVLLQVNGRPVASPMEVQELVRTVPVGETVMLDVLRDGAQQQMQATLMAGRQAYQSSFRGDDMSANGDLMSRTMRLEQQLAMVIQELRNLREQVAQLRGSAQPTAGAGVGLEQPQTETSVEELEQQPPAQEFQQFEQRTSAPLPAEPAPQPVQPAAQPEAEQPADAAEDEDLFGTSATETETETTTAPATETETEAETESAETETESAETESETETDTDTDSLFN